MTPSKILLFFLLSFIGGVFISSFTKIPGLIVVELFVLGVFYIIILFRHKAIVVFSLCLIVLGLGIWRTESAETGESFRSSYQFSYYKEDEPPPAGFLSIVSENLLLLKQRFKTVINQNLSPPQSSILSAILLGDKQGISKEWKEKLNRAGVRHITAISGMHIVILSGILIWLGIKLGFYRGQSFYFALVFLWLFITMVGFQPSAVRAGIMGSMFLFCEKIGRQKTADRALLLTGAVMLAFNPSLLRHSIGFQLSFLASLGIIYLMPVFQSLLQKLFQFFHNINPLTSDVRGLNVRGLSNLTSLLSMTFAAQVFTLPILIYHFGQFSIVSALTNILIVPFLPYLMVSGFLFVIFGAIWHLLSFIFLFPVWLLLTYITKITNLFAGFSFSFLNFQIHWLWLLLIYALLAIILWQIKKQQRAKLLP